VLGKLALVQTPMCQTCTRHPPAKRGGDLDLSLSTRRGGVGGTLGSLDIAESRAIAKNNIWFLPWFLRRCAYVSVCVCDDVLCQN
jgi:hypothetical protein